jgi:integrase/recombinase XerD
MEENHSNIDPQLLKSISDFKSMIISELCLSKNTVSAYVSDIFQFLRSNGSSFEPDCFQKYLTSNELTNASIRRKISSISSWQAFCKKELGIELNIDIPKIKARKTIPDVVSNDDVQVLLESKNIDLRLRTIIILLKTTGMRISELLSIQYVDIEQVLNKNANTFRIIGKGNKERTVFLKKETKELLQEYCFTTGIKKGNIWKNITRQYVYMLLKKLSSGVGVLQSRIYPHSFRHRFGSNLAQGGMSLIEIQKLLGHEHINTTAIYTHIEDEVAYNLVLENHPLGKKAMYKQSKVEI